MKRGRVIGIRELARNVSKVIDSVEARQPVLITKHGTPVALMLPINPELLEEFLTKTVKQMYPSLKRLVK